MAACPTLRLRDFEYLSNEAADALLIAANIRRLMLAVDIARAQGDGALIDMIGEMEAMRSGIPEDREDFRTRIMLERHMKVPGTVSVPSNISDAGLSAIGITTGKPDDGA